MTEDLTYLRDKVGIYLKAGDIVETISYPTYHLILEKIGREYRFSDYIENKIPISSFNPTFYDNCVIIDVKKIDSINNI
jgi:hypothetical protein